MTEAVRGITALAFDALGARRVDICCDSLNHPSVRVAQRAGFRPEGERQASGGLAYQPMAIRLG